MSLAMKEQVSIYCKNTNTYRDYPVGTSLLEIYNDMKAEIGSKFLVVSARVNNRMEDLNFRIYRPKDIQFIDLTHASGMRVYVRTLAMALTNAVARLFPDAEIRVEHSISKGYFCSLSGLGKEITDREVMQIKNEMIDIIDENFPIIKKEKQTKEVVNLFERYGMKEKSFLLETLGMPYSSYYKLDGIVDFYNGVMLPSTNYIYLFDLLRYYDGLLLRIPSRQNPEVLEEAILQPKLFEVFKEYTEWNKITGTSNVGQLNQMIKNKLYGGGSSLIKIAEALHEKKIARIADSIVSKGNIRVVLVSGPSSSGKTTFSKRLAVQLVVNKRKPVTLSLDNYYVEREQSPRDKNGEYDYESLYALDLELFATQLEQILNGEEVQLPTYDFVAGKKKYLGNTLKLGKDDILIIEGIHALNNELTKNVAREEIFGVYVSALTTVSLDGHNWIPTTDTRLLRRIVRDNQYRGTTAKATIARWQSVRDGEEKWIFPYQENADVMFNSALLFEFSVLKRHAEPVLQEVLRIDDEYAEACRLLQFLRFFTPIEDAEIPPNSLLREFLGGSSFKY